MSGKHLQNLTSRRILAALVTIAWPLALQGQTASTMIDVTGYRPLAGAIDALERATGGAINYEDVPYENSADLVDFSTPEQRADGSGYQLLGPRPGQVGANVQTASNGQASVNESVFDANLLLASYRSNRLPGDFTVEQANGMLYVVAAKVLGRDGTVRNVTSPMKALVTVPYAQRNVADTVDAILESVFKTTGTRIPVGSLPFWPTDMASFGARGEPARDALARLLAQVGGRPMSYRLLFDPKAGYVLHIRLAAEANPMHLAPAVLGPAASSNPAPPPTQTPGALFGARRPTPH